MASASRFVPLELPLDEFIEEHSNKNMLSKTNRDVSLLKEFSRAKEVDKEIENLEAKELDEVLHLSWKLKKRTEENMSQQH